jgi:uncharacterized membrane protein
MPIHWNAAGKVDGYASKTFAALFTPVMNVVMALLISAITLIDPRMRKADAEGRANFRRIVRILRLVFTAFLAAVALAVIFIGAGFALDMSRVVGVSFALLIGVFGNLLGKVRPNYLVGVRTPWTLESREVWIKTHRLTGRLMVGGAILMLIVCFAAPATVAFWINMSLLLLISLVAVLYSFLAYRKEERTVSTRQAPTVS